MRISRQQGLSPEKYANGDVLLWRRRIPMLFFMKVEWPKRDLTIRWVVGIEDTTKV